MRRTSAPVAKNYDAGVRRSLGIPTTTGPARTSQRPARVRTRLTERKTATDVPLAGLSFQWVLGPHAAITDTSGLRRP
jgi:hypothetical protein